MNLLLALVVMLAALAGAASQLVRWLRVAQREHYLPGTTWPFVLRWTASSLLNVLTTALIGLVLVEVLILRRQHPVLTGVLALLASLLLVVVPIGLEIKGRTSKLAYTERLRRLMVVAAVLVVIVALAVGLLWSLPAGALSAALLVAPSVGLALRILSPSEKKRMQHFVDQAGATLTNVHPLVVAITGSYGKTSTKLHLMQFASGARRMVATPASFNNRGGLARAINEHLTSGTEVFVAEMGTYGPGEIADLCSWIPPTISVITAIGPVHLERFGSLEVTLQAKAEITESASTVILNIDDVRLSKLADDLSATGKEVVRCSGTSLDADVSVVVGTNGLATIARHGHVLQSDVTLPAGVQASNVACAWAAAASLGIDDATIEARLGYLAPAENRSVLATSSGGTIVLDDTFNANPAGAKSALRILQSLDVDRRILVTPGMIELGVEQAEENEAFARLAATVVDVALVVGRTNHRALLRGLSGSNVQVLSVPTRDAAVTWVRANAGARDAVLYENDLPDHYP